jgi:hypothetical protein
MEFLILFGGNNNYCIIRMDKGIRGKREKDEETKINFALGNVHKLFQIDRSEL